MKASKPSSLFAMIPCWNTDNGSRQTSMSAPRQRGVVLVFSLITLLVLTLLSINMIQQNRLEFMMAGNAQTQTEAFTAAEDILKVTENYIDTLHANNSQECLVQTCKDIGGIGVACNSPAATTVSYQCLGTTTTPYDTPVTPAWDVDLPSTRIIPGRLYRCYTTDGKFTQLQASDVGADTPPPWNITDRLDLNAAKIGTTEVSITSVACITSTETEGGCEYDVAGGLMDILPCHSAALDNCLTQLYTLQVVSKLPGTSAARTAESKYAVRCDADAGPKP